MLMVFTYFNTNTIKYYHDTTIYLQCVFTLHFYSETIPCLNTFKYLNIVRFNKNPFFPNMYIIYTLLDIQFSTV